MGMTEAIRIALVKRGNISEAELARRLEISPQNLHNKMKRDNFTETDLQEIAKALGLNVRIYFEDPTTGEKISYARAIIWDCRYLILKNGEGAP